MVAVNDVLQEMPEPRELDRTRRSGASTLALAALAIGVACVWFLTLDARHLLPSDEGRYASIAREMLASGDWVTVRYNGLKYFEKPPLQIWMTALAFQAFGIGEWQARLWTAFSGAAGLVVGALAFVLASVLIAQHPSASPATRRNWMLGAWAAMAVAVLTKGPVAIALPGLVLVVYSALARDFAVWRRLHLGVGLLVLVAIAAPWFVLVSERNPEFARFFFIHEHLQRYLSHVHHREGAWWYFVPQLAMGFLPWLGLAWPMVKVVRAEPADAGFRPLLLLAVWATAIFVFFSASSSKLPGYIVPIYPALAILAACALDRLTPTEWRRQVGVAIVLVLIACAAPPFLAQQGSAGTPNAVYREFALWLAAALGIAVVGLAVAWRLGAASTVGSMAAYALAFFALVTVGLRGHEAFGLVSSGAPLAARAAPLLDETMPLYGVRLFDYTLPFYLRHTLTLVELPGELEFGIQQEPQKWLPTIDAFVREWTSPRRALAVMSRPTYDELRSRALPMVVVGEDPRRIVVANFEGSHR